LSFTIAAFEGSFGYAYNDDPARCHVSFLAGCLHMCGDKNAMEWATAWMDHKEPPANKVGFMYMLRGDGGASNTDPYATKEEPGNNWIKTGAHVMIVGSGAKMLDGYPRDAKADPTRPYVMWPGTQYEHLMLPVR
jgi:hypothetical protein